MATFGVAEVQVRRDHAISHILAALSRHRSQELIFFGGTALSRTYLLDERLSEDIDLIAVAQRDGLADVLLKDINAAGRLLRNEGVVDGSCKLMASCIVRREVQRATASPTSVRRPPNPDRRARLLAFPWAGKCGHRNPMLSR
jgi:predicted nucleotidyltransferase component of viral defense system